MTATPNLADEPFCYLTTRGRVTGAPHTIEIWFGLSGSSLYMLSGSARSDWVLNLAAEPEVTVRVGGRAYRGRARVVAGNLEEARARELVAGKYQPSYAGDLTRWKQTATVVAVDLPDLPVAGDDTGVR